MEGLRHRQRMRDLFTVPTGLSIFSHDRHFLESSPTATPAHTRSASPLRGTVVPHSSREAADFVSKLNDITEVREIDETSFVGVEPSNQIKKNFALLATTTTTSRPDKYNFAARSDRFDLIEEDEEVEEMAQVSTIDGSASVTVASKVQVLLLYLAFNLGLTLYNKAVMIKVSMNHILANGHQVADRTYSSPSLSY